MFQAADHHFPGFAVPAAESGTVVWLGAPGVVLSATTLSGARVHRWVLVHGDRRTALRQAAAVRGMPRVEVRSQVLSSASGTAAWHRGSVPGHGGVVPAGDSVRSRYPRFEETVVAPVNAVGLVDFLQALHVGRERDLPNGLVLASPSDAAGLFDSLEDAALRAFAWVAVRGDVRMPAPLESTWCAFPDVGRMVPWLVCRRDDAKADLCHRLDLQRAEESARRRRLDDELEQQRAEAAKLRESLDEERRLGVAVQDRLARAEAKLELLQNWSLAGDPS